MTKNVAVCVSLKAFVDIEVNLCWATLPVIKPSGQKT